MSTDVSKIVEQVVEDFNNGDFLALQKVIAEDAVWHVPGSNQLSGVHRGKKEFVENFQAKVQGLTESATIDFVNIYTGPDSRVIVTYDGSYKRNGNELDYRIAYEYQFKDGKIAEAWLHVQDFEVWNAFWSD